MRQPIKNSKSSTRAYILVGVLFVFFQLFRLNILDYTVSTASSFSILLSLLLITISSVLLLIYLPLLLMVKVSISFPTVRVKQIQISKTTFIKKVYRFIKLEQSSLQVYRC